MRMAQVLPVNDTSVYMTQWDSYPYCSLSVFALHPQYLCLEALSGPAMAPLPSQRLPLPHKVSSFVLPNPKS